MVDGLMYTSWGDGQSYPGGGRCLKSGTPAMHCHTARGQWAVELLQSAGPPAAWGTGSPAQEVVAA